MGASLGPRQDAAAGPGGAGIGFRPGPKADEGSRRGPDLRWAQAAPCPRWNGQLVLRCSSELSVFPYCCICRLTCWNLDGFLFCF